MTMTHPVRAPKKLIEVALPLNAINEASAREKSIRHGHPSTLHIWWARRPLAAARAVIFGQLVNDPSWKWELERPGEIPPNHLKATWAKSRKRLFSILEELVQWTSTTNEAVLERARTEISKSWRETCELNKDHPRAAELFNPDNLPALHDPFAGGGAIPLEAQRLGLKARASDLNPVAVLINKAMIEIPPRFLGRSPIGPLRTSGDTQELELPREWPGGAGLAEDVRRYGAWLRDRAVSQLGHLYPPVEVTAAMAEGRPDLQALVGKRLTVTAWLWVRTVSSPNPAFRHVAVPLASSFLISSRDGAEAYVEPIVEGDAYRFRVKLGSPVDIEAAKCGTRAGKGQDFLCVMSRTAIPRAYVRDEGKAGRLSSRLMAVVAEGPDGPVYLAPPVAAALDLDSHPVVAEARRTFLSGAMPTRAMTTGGVCTAYGMTTYGQLFTSRQILSLVAMSDLIAEARERAHKDAIAAGFGDEILDASRATTGATAYANAIALYLAFALSKCTDYWNSHATWMPRGTVGHLFARHAIPMTWDYPEANPFADFHCNWVEAVGWVAKAIETLPCRNEGIAECADAASQPISSCTIISTDPPYYDNIGYAELSDFFYVWLRRALKPTYPELFATVATPKADELIAIPQRHGGKQQAESFFLHGMTRAMNHFSAGSHPAFPLTIYYAFKQSETKDYGTASAGWETFLGAVFQAGLSLTGTWPIRTERQARTIGMGTNALASSIVLVCRPRPTNTPPVSRRAFLRELNQLLPEALDEMTKGSGDERSPVAPVDLSQAIIGPGMAVFSKYSAVLEADGSPMSVRTALTLINRFLAEDDFDPDTQFCLHWFEQYGWKDGRFGDADTLARAKGTSVDGVKQAGVLYAVSGVVRLLKWADYPADWNPKIDIRLPIWEALHQMIRVLKAEGETGAGAVLAAIAAKAEATRQLAYRLYTLCERAGWAEDARAYNELITSWSGIESAAAKAVGPRQARLFDV